MTYVFLVDPISKLQCSGASVGVSLCKLGNIGKLEEHGLCKELSGILSQSMPDFFSFSYAVKCKEM